MAYHRERDVEGGVCFVHQQLLVFWGKVIAVLLAQELALWGHRLGAGLFVGRTRVLVPFGASDQLFLFGLSSMLIYVWRSLRGEYRFLSVRGVFSLPALLFLWLNFVWVNLNLVFEILSLGVFIFISTSDCLWVFRLERVVIFPHRALELALPHRGAGNDWRVVHFRI